ncbi:hypothetical protein [Vibrio sp. D431a]|uniref:hypothetical protein n=1 Tax=Vibrio sp. D431a TaxID=2837388 RepID=UPI002554B436|nr:hypothetical protein [Vibrio sp. D431a]MDK9793760.1 hypothetical protein [Vibrio sp. D431a]
MFKIEKLIAINALNDASADVCIQPNDEKNLSLTVNGVFINNFQSYTEACEELMGLVNNGLRDTEELALEASELIPDADFGECQCCGEVFMRDKTTSITNHITTDCGIDHDKDADHTPY